MHDLQKNLSEKRSLPVFAKVNFCEIQIFVTLSNQTHAKSKYLSRPTHRRKFISLKLILSKIPLLEKVEYLKTHELEEKHYLLNHNW